jgi:hypothetical protein
VKRIVVILLLTTLVQTAFAQKDFGSDGRAKSVVRFYPNPASTTINFEFSNPVEKGAVLQVYSFLGRKVGHLTVSGNRLTVNLTDFVSGIYIFQLRDATGRIVESNKFQVAK